MEDTPILTNKVVFVTCERHLHPDSITWAPGKLTAVNIYVVCGCEMENAVKRKIKCNEIKVEI